jgi:hypothetical protein
VRPRKATRRQHTRAMASEFGPTVVEQPSGSHTGKQRLILVFIPSKQHNPSDNGAVIVAATVVFLHGLGDSGAGISAVAQALRLPHVLL